jgi:hypothetical protein
MNMKFLSLTTGAVLLGVSHAAANTIYSYTGNDFTDISYIANAFDIYTTNSSITGSFTVSTPLGANFDGTNFPLIDYTFSDGAQTLNNDNSTDNLFEINTNAAGAITAWAIEIIGSVSGVNYSDAIDVLNLPPSLEIFDEGSIESPNGAFGYVDDDPGIWTVSQTPLPAAFPLFATGLGALGLFGWRRKRKAQAVVA